MSKEQIENAEQSLKLSQERYEAALKAEEVLQKGGSKKWAQHIEQAKKALAYARASSGCTCLPSVKDPDCPVCGSD